MSRFSVVAALSLAGVACADDSHSGALLSGPDAQVSDATTGGAAHFYWLPPLKEEPTTTGEFHPGVSPTVSICRLQDTMSAERECDAGPPVRSWTAEEVVHWITGEAYYVRWATASETLETWWHYRASVFLGNVEIGYMDLQPVPTWKDRADPQHPDRFQFTVGQEFNIKFRIERGVLCDLQPVDCGVTAVGPEGGLATTDSGFGGALFPEGALTETINIIVRRQTDRPCLPTDLLQFDGCFVFETEPHVESFSQPVIIGECLDPNADLSEAQRDLLLIHKFEQDDPDSIVTVTDNVFAGFLTCGPFQSASREPRAPLTQLARTLYDRLLRVAMLRPQPVFAVHKGLGSTIGSFSQGGWALPAVMTLYAGDAQTAPAGSAVAIPPAVLLQDSSGAPIEGMVVRFRIDQGGGSLTKTVDTTDANGVAEAGTWTLGTPGTNTVVAESRGPVGSPTVFTATATAAPAPVVDGVLGPGEWDAATPHSFIAQIGGGGVSATLYVLSHTGTLYLAVALATNDGQPNDLRVDFDNDGDGAPALGDDAIGLTTASVFQDLHLTAACLRSRQSSCGTDDVRAGGTRDGQGALGQQGTMRVYELAHPLNSGDAGHDLAVGPGNTFGLFLSLSVGNGAQGNTQWPGFRNYLRVTVP